MGHVEHITIGRVADVPRAGEIVHLASPQILPGGGGGIAFAQLARSDADVHFFTAIGDDDAGRFVEDRIRATGARIHAARRSAPHTRDVVLIGPGGERTIVVVGEPLHPTASDPMPWELLSELDAVYFTARDPELLRRARGARILLATARRRPSIVASNVRLDAILGSRADARENGTLADYPIPPHLLVMTEGPAGGSIETARGTDRFTAPKVASVAGAYGAGDTFAGAFTYHLARGLDPIAAAERASEHAAAVLSSLDPLAAQQPLGR